jgi:hypothetical protein
MFCMDGTIAHYRPGEDYQVVEMRLVESLGVENRLVVKMTAVAAVLCRLGAKIIFVVASSFLPY